jgi:general secretion pathway protein F
MAAFRYKAMTATGALVSGVIDAPSEAMVVQRIRDQGNFPISTAAAGSGSPIALLRGLIPRKRVSLRNLNIATQELATLLQAGLELDRALGILLSLGDLGPLKQSFATVRARVRDGSSFADALAADPLFPRFYVGMVRAGEMGGSLEPTLRRLCDYLMRTLAVRETVTSALVYPTILLVTAGISIIFIITVVLPEFQPLFEQAGKALPLPTRIVIAFGDFFRAYWWALVILGIAAVVAFRRALANPASRRQVHGLLLRLPLFGRLLAAIEIERFCRTLGTLLSNGVALPSALGLAKDVLWNSVISDVVKDTASSLREGESIANRLGRSKIFTTVTLDLIKVGEETGKLDEMLLRQADLDEQRIRHSIDRLLSLLVPGLTILLGLVIGGLITSMLMAILSVNDLALQ